MPNAIRVLFVCLHGSAKSVIAAHHLRRLAAARGVILECGSAGAEPDDAVPPHVIAGLSADGFDVAVNRPALVSQEMIADARYVVSFGCDLSAFENGAGVTRWDDVPAVSDGYADARDAIVARLGSLLDAITDDASPAPKG